MNANDIQASATTHAGYQSRENANDIQASATTTHAGYRMFMRGEDVLQTHRVNLNADYGFSDWQQDNNMAPELSGRDNTDFIRSGETLEIWAINRVTGYLGSQRITLGEQALTGALIDSHVPTIEMRPPNLKIWAERTYDIEAGLNQGDTRHYLIGNEGVGEADDTYILLYTDWRAADGRPLPDALSQYGYTARLAYVSGANTLTNANVSGATRFGIKPGLHTELMRLQGSLQSEHYYLQVNAVPAEEFDDFALSDANESKYRDRSGEANFDGIERNYYRPERFVPFKTARYNEQLSEIQQQAYRIEKRRRETQGLSLDNLAKPKILYDWYYRPDYQFSVYDLAVNKLNLQNFDNATANNEAPNLLDTDSPVISVQDIVQILYDWSAPEQTALERFDSEQTFVLNIGQQEVALNVDEHNTLTFDNLDYLNQLGSDDYLTLAIYTNEDSANLLYQYAFASTGLQVYYNIPAIPPSDPAPQPEAYLHRINRNSDEPAMLRTLGGMRLKYAYLPPKVINEEGNYVPAAVQQLQIEFSENGR
ncbi:MAG: hypothetical protein P8X74_20655, partial [Reinekea sp.]